MNKATSSYLDTWRILAAVVVLMGHVNDWSGKGLPPFTSAFAAQSVVVFFVLSGFVISYVAGRREDDWRSYTISRAARIYSVALPAIVLTFVVDALCAPLPYWTRTDTVTQSSILQFAAGVTFMTEIWGNHIQVSANGPYWSMGYEVPFYLCFGLAWFLPGRSKWATLMAIGFFGPRVAIMGSIWLLGGAIQIICRRRLVGTGVGAAMFVIAISAWIGFDVLTYRGAITLSDAPLYWHKSRDLSADFLVAGLFAASIVGLDAACRDRTVPLWLRRPVQWVAGATFTLYLFHVPIAQALMSTTSLRLDTATGKAALIAFVMVATLLIAEATERRKTWWHALFARALAGTTS